MSSLIQKESLSHSLQRSRGEATFTLTQLIRYFAADLPSSSNYPRHAKAYVNYCLQNRFAIDGISFSRYTTNLPPNRVSPIRKFLLFYQQIGQPTVIADSKSSPISPAANELILRFIREAKNLRGDQSKITYTKSLNAFFIYIQHQLQLNKQASLCGITVADFVQHLRAEDYSPFTINLYLSALKQLAIWCIRHRNELSLTDYQLNDLRDIEQVRGLAIERTFYKDSLEKQEQERFLSTVESARDIAILTLLCYEGLRTVELTRLRLGDLDFNRERLYVLGKGKHTKKPIKFFGVCRQAIEDYLIEKKRWPLCEEYQQEWLFDKLKTYQIRYIVDKHLQRSRLKRKGMSAHSLRHTAGQLLLDAGVSLEHVQQHLRHESIETTQFYTKKRTQQMYIDQMPN